MVVVVNGSAVSENVWVSGSVLGVFPLTWCMNLRTRDGHPPRRGLLGPLMFCQDRRMETSVLNHAPTAIPEV